MVIVGTTEGEIHSHTARDPNSVGTDKPHASVVTAMVCGWHVNEYLWLHCDVCLIHGNHMQDIGHVSATGAKVVLSASERTIAVHEAAIRSVAVRRLALVELPMDPGLPPVRPRVADACTALPKAMRS